MFNRRTESKETLIFQIIGSDAVYQTLSDLSQTYPDTILTPLHLLQYLTKKRRLVGGLVVSEATNLPPLKRQDPIEPIATIKISGQTIRCTQNLADLLNLAQESAGQGNIIRTEHLVIAESQLPDSIVLSSLKSTIGKEFHTPKYIAEVAKEIKKIAPLTESGSRTIEVKNAPNQELNYVDLIQAAKSGEIKFHSAKKVWIRSILTSLESSATVTAIDTDSSQEAVSIMEGLALSLASDTKGAFSYKSIICINPLRLENNPEIAIKDAVNLAKNGILFLPNLKEYLGFKSVRSAIASKSIKIVTTTSAPNPTEFRKIDPILNSANHVHLEAMTANEAFDILVKTKPELEKRLGNGLNISITDASLKRAAEQALMYQTSLNLPTIQGAETLIARALTLIKLDMAGLQELDKVSIKSDLQIDPEDILIALKDLTGIESFTDNPEKYLNMEEELSKRVAGQDEAIKIVSDKIRSAKAGIKDPKKPIGNFAFFGPSGVGKSELAKALAEFLFGSENALIQIQMNTLNSEASINTLRGSQSGYVNSDDGGSLTEAVSKRPYSVICLDEFEKAHPKVQDMFHGILEDGKTQNGKGRDVDFRNTIIIITSNAGSELYYDQEKVGKEETKKRVLEAVKERFRPDFLNRFDGIVAFNTLDIKVVRTIVDIIIKGKNKLLSQSAGITLELTPEAKESFCSRGFSPAWGARPLKRLIENEIVSPLSKLILGRKISPGDIALVSFEDNQIVLRKK